MARRHSSGHAVQWRITRPALALLAFLIFCLIATTTIVVRHFGAKSSAAPVCPNSVTIRVAVAPSMMGAMQEHAQQWNSIDFARDGVCIKAQVYQVNSASEEALLATSAADRPALWIPDSSYWVTKLQNDLMTRNSDHHIAAMKVKPTLALSPLVLVASQAKTSALAAAGGVNWSGIAAMASNGELAIENPLRTSEGLLSLTALRTALGSAFDLSSASQTASAHSLNSVDAGFTQLAADPQHALPFLASEQEVAAANTAHGSTFANSTYISDGTLSLDYPAVRLDYPGQDAILAPGADGFYQAFAAGVSAKVKAVGLRDSSGAAQARANGDVSTSALPFTSLPTPDSATPAMVWAAWPSAGRNPRVLFALDISTLMTQPLASGQSKAGLEVGTAISFSSFLPDSAQVGLWGYAVNLTSTLDWLARVPLDALGSDGTRTQLQQQTSLLSAPTNNGSSLYNTTLAAFYNVTNNYQAGRQNYVVVMTGSGNRDAASVTLDQLLTTLRQQYNPAKPVHIISIGVGDGADTNALGLIAAATGGKSYVAQNSNQALQYLLDTFVTSG